MRVLISDPRKLLRRVKLNQREVREIARRVIGGEYRGKIPLSKLKVSIAFVSDEEMIPINQTYTGREGSTDVLAFSMVDELDEKVPFFMLGEVIVSVDRAISQAEEAGWAPGSEVKLLVIHGLLHLLGYDHTSNEDKERMRLKEREYLI
ncbi:MAG: rRNA maturation RNase YbeY [Synergistetes bacterium]|nr:rRNA maturation RNase YbeY [Synergistota bacterium]